MASLKDYINNAYDFITGIVDPKTSFFYNDIPDDARDNFRMLSNTIKTGGKEYAVYTSNGDYWYRDSNNEIQVLDPDVFTKLLLNTTKNKAINLDDYNKLKQGINTTVKNVKKTLDKINSTKDMDKAEVGLGVKAAADLATKIDPNTQALINQNNTLITELNAERERYKELTRVMSADEAAEHFGIDYNLQNILDDYNEATNAYYDNAMAELIDINNDTIRNNANYARRLANDYLESNRNVAGTSTNRGTMAANVLNNQLNMGSSMSYADYQNQQNLNNMREHRKQELTSNKLLAEQYYNELGNYLSTLTAQKNASDVKQYIDTLDAYSQGYSANKQVAGYLANAQATKYSGLANASSISAAAKANNALNDFNTNYNYWYNYYGGDATAAAKAVSTSLLSSVNKFNK